jgi:hypothetical protein
MQSKFFTPAISLIFSALVATLANAQPAASPPPKVGYIRFWDMLPAKNGSFEVRKATSSKSEPTMLLANAYHYSGYGEYPAGRYQLGVFKRGGDQPLKLFNVDLKPDSYFTILLSPQSIDMFEDTINPRTTTGTLIIRNYFSGTTVSASSGAQKFFDALPYGQSYTIGDLPLSRLSVVVRTHLPGGHAAQAAAEVNFKEWKRATLLVVPDSYGRFRVRVTPNGMNL